MARWTLCFTDFICISFIPLILVLFPLLYYFGAPWRGAFRQSVAELERRRRPLARRPLRQHTASKPQMSQFIITDDPSKQDLVNEQALDFASACDPEVLPAAKESATSFRIPSPPLMFGRLAFIDYSTVVFEIPVLYSWKHCSAENPVGRRGPATRRASETTRDRRLRETPLLRIPLLVPHDQEYFPGNLTSQWEWYLREGPSGRPPTAEQKTT